MRSRRKAAALLLAAPLLAGAACAPATPPAPEPAEPAQAPQAQTPVASPGRPGLENDQAPALPAPVALPADPGEAGARAFVEELMAARVRGDGPRARDFLSPAALEQYERGAGGLVLTGSAEEPFSGWELLGLNAADASSYEVTVLIRASQDFQETFFIGPGADASGTQRPWIVRGATRS